MWTSREVRSPAMIVWPRYRRSCRRQLENDNAGTMWGENGFNTPTKDESKIKTGSKGNGLGSYIGKPGENERQVENPKQPEQPGHQGYASDGSSHDGCCKRVGW